MDASRFDSWTRRRFGLAIGGIAVLLRLPARDDVTAKKKRCKKSERRCGNKCVKGTCCPGKACGGGECQCTRTVERKPFCKPSDERVGSICGGALCPLCTASDDCENEFKCVMDDTFGFEKRCQPPCGFEV